MYLAPTLSEQQNVALIAASTFLVVFTSALFLVGLLGAFQRNR